jgi:peptide/nickel transport system substrate-binding protein
MANMKTRSGLLTTAIFFAATITCPSSAHAQATPITVAVGAPVTSMDPHYHTLSPNEQAHAHVFDRLVETDEKARLRPGLAESWKLVDDKTWEFKLRTTNFHDGSPFTAEDIAYTIARVPTVPNSPGSFAIYTNAVSRVEIVDAHTIRLHTKGVYPLLPVDLSQVFVISHKLGPNPATEDFNNGKNTNGTGPFRFVSYKNGDRIELDRNDGFWGEKPAWSHVTYRMITNEAARTAALLSGDVALIDSVPTADIATLRTDPRMKLWETVSLRLIYIMLDQSREGPTPFVKGPNGETLDKNPLKDRRVREALSIAINRPAIVDRVMENAAIPSGQFLPPGSFSYAPDVTPPAFDPARAKALLAEAGYPNGLTITLHSSNDRYLNDAKIVQTVGQMWSRIGIKTTVEPSPWANFVGHASKQDYSAFLLGWGSSTGESSNPLRSLVATFDASKGRGAVNRARYSNPALDALIDKALVTVDDGAREKILMDGVRMVMADQALIPLHQQKNTWATKAGLTYIPRADEETRVFDLRPSK